MRSSDGFPLNTFVTLISDVTFSMGESLATPSEGIPSIGGFLFGLNAGVSGGFPPQSDFGVMLRGIPSVTIATHVHWGVQVLVFMECTPRIVARRAGAHAQLSNGVPTLAPPSHPFVRGLPEASVISKLDIGRGTP